MIPLAIQIEENLQIEFKLLCWKMFLRSCESHETLSHNNKYEKYMTWLCYHNKIAIFTWYLNDILVVEASIGLLYVHFKLESKCNFYMLFILYTNKMYSYNFLFSETLVVFFGLIRLDFKPIGDKSCGDWIWCFAVNKAYSISFSANILKGQI
jgi:hypothetical protein